MARTKFLEQPAEWESRHIHYCICRTSDTSNTRVLCRNGAGFCDKRERDSKRAAIWGFANYTDAQAVAKYLTDVTIVSKADLSLLEG